MREKLQENKIGEVISASVLSGLEAKLEVESPEELRIGYPVIAEGAQYDFYCLVHDIVNQPLELAERLAGMKSKESVVPAAIHEGYSGRIFYSKAKLRPIQLIGKKDGKLLEADTIPPYFSAVRLAREDDVAKIYSKTPSSAPLGSLRGVEGFWINIDFQKLAEKPFGIFGRTGAGKSVLNKLVCGGIIAKDAASVLVFDMQDEYGTYSRSDRSFGLKHFFPERVEMYSLDPANRNAHDFMLSASEIEPDDLIVALRDLSQNMIDAIYVINRKRKDTGKDLLAAIASATEDEYPENEIHSSVLNALKRKAGRLQRFKFIKDIDGRKDAFSSILAAVKSRKSVVLQFGGYGTDSSVYLFVANVLSRRLFDIYTEKNEEMPRLVVFLEEAHKFLSPGIADFTVFSKLARETRKFNLILALVDQRPSQIDDEVRSQLANRLVMSLKEPSDISSALSGVPDRSVWENIVATIPNRTVMVVGDAIRVPTVISVMNYDEENVRKHIIGDDGKLTGKEMDEIAKGADKLFK